MRMHLKYTNFTKLTLFWIKIGPILRTNEMSATSGEIYTTGSGYFQVLTNFRLFCKTGSE